jgi:hypothetical protein
MGQVLLVWIQTAIFGAIVHSGLQPAPRKMKIRKDEINQMSFNFSFFEA